MVELAVVQVAGGWRLIGPNSKGRMFDYRVDAVDALLRTGAEMATDEAQVTLLIHEAGRLVRVGPDGARLEPVETAPFLA